MGEKKFDIVWKDSNFTKSHNDEDIQGKNNRQVDKNMYEQSRERRKLASSKPMIIAILSGLVIGSILGFLLLSMFTQFPIETSNLPVTGIDSTKTDQNTTDAIKNTYSNYVLPEINAHVLQVGLFSEEKNALKWLSIYEEADMMTYLWKTKTNNYLLGGVLATEASAKEQVVNIKEAGFDAFAKPWKSGGQEVMLTESEYTWLQAMVEAWKKSLTIESSHLDDAWGQLLAKQPSDTPHISDLLAKITQLHKNKMMQANEKEAQMILLEILYDYNSL